MVAITGFVGMIYVRIDEDWRGDVWKSEVWPTPKQVLDEFHNKQEEVLTRLGWLSEFYSYDSAADKDSNAEDISAYRKMISELRTGLHSNGVEDSFGDVEVSVTPITVHLPHVTNAEWGRLCGKDTIS